MNDTALLHHIAQTLLARRWQLATAESCTGGLIAAACTALPGSSQWLERGFVTYSNAAKTALLGVPAACIATHGAVSQPVAEAMALGALAHAPVQAALSVTGIAGPDGGSAAKPVGTVWFGWALQAPGQPAQAHTACHLLPGDRAAVRQQAVHHALAGLLQLIQKQ